MWNELTAREHLNLFARLKGVAIPDLSTEISEKLDMVGLTKSGDIMAGKFSGGMKRRLSVAIAAIGDPQVRTSSVSKVVLTNLSIDYLFG